MMELIIEEILKTFIISSIGIILLLIFRKVLFKGYSKTFNYLVWLLVLVRMLIPINYEIDISSYFNIYANGEGIFIDIVNFVDYVFKSVNKIATKELGYLWLIVVTVLTGCKIVHYILLKNKVISSCHYVVDEGINKLFKDTLLELKIKKNIRLLQSTDNTIPFGIGLIKSYVIIPNINYSEEELKWIIKHELTHFKYKDIFYKHIVMVVTIIYWFNPLVYIMDRIICKDCELACDERVLRKCNKAEKQQYALTILNSIKKSKDSKVIMSSTLGKGVFVKTRVENIFQEDLKRGFLAFIIIFIIVSFSLVRINIGEINNIIGEPKLFYLYENEDLGNE